MLPEQKKTPEEIAVLRGKLGIPTIVSTSDLAAEPVATLKPDLLHDVEDVPEPVIDPITGLPVHRHSGQELERIRLRGMFETQDHALRLPARRERTWIVVGGYLFATSAAIPVYHKLPIMLPAAIALLSLAFGAYLFFLRPYSKHHGAFIGIVVLFVLTYAALQYFPQLRHAT
jgi:hypothetical protein